MEKIIKPKLQLLIAAYGREGLERVASYAHPQTEGVEYLVGWQMPGIDNPESIINSFESFHRPDFHILWHNTTGVARNRNFLLDNASAPLALLSDDDVSYTSEQLKKVIAAFERYPEVGFITLRYSADDPWQKKYPGNGDFNLKCPPRFYYSGAIEMAFRLNVIRAAGIRFNEHFGFGKDEFLSGEDTVFMHSALRKGINGIHVAEVICHHHGGPSTCNREGNNARFIESKGAIVSWLHPLSWPLRMLTQAQRCSSMSKATFIRAWLCGVWKAKKRRIWKGY